MSNLNIGDFPAYENSSNGIPVFLASLLWHATTRQILTACLNGDYSWSFGVLNGFPNVIEIRSEYLSEIDETGGNDWMHLEYPLAHEFNKDLQLLYVIQFYQSLEVMFSQDEDGGGEDENQQEEE